jgi:NAD(P) transhydrogenase subunit alpha
MKIVVLRETQEGEARVALMPESIKKLTSLGASVQVESGAGLSAARTDDDYRDAGAEVSPDREAMLADADVLAAVNRPAANDFARLRKGAVVIGFLRPLDEPAALIPALDRGVTTFSVELIPRITRAQAMDALSSMATVAGYKAVLIGAAHIPRMFPLLMTAAGQDVKSLGATFLEVDLGGIKTQDAGGYAVELSEEAMNRGRALIAEHAKTADVIITTAQVPGRRAPLLVTKEAVEGMKRGSIIIDLAGSTGGNCALSQADVTVERDGVTILAPTNLPATVPVHASQLYSRNVTSFLSPLIKDGQLQLDMNDDIVGPSCVTHNGEVVNQRVAAALQAQPG